MAVVQCRVMREHDSGMVDRDVWVDKPPPLQFDAKGRATVGIETSVDHILAWYFKGNTGLKFKLTVVAPVGYEVRFVGQHPVEGQITKTYSSASDTRRFYVKEAKP